MEFLITVAAGFVLAALAPLLVRLVRDKAGWLLALLPLGLLAFLVSRIPAVAAGEAFHESHAWVPSLGVNLSFHLDGLSLLFGILITGIGTFIVVYAGGYLHHHPDLPRFYVFILVFMASMLGVVLSDNLLTLFVFWELTSISSYLLIGFEHKDPDARKSALQALLVTGGGGLVLMAGLILLGLISGSFNVTDVIADGGAVRGHGLYELTLALVLVGAFTKSAQFPFHFWLPGAMAAPTPVSAYLHSATMVKLGIYLLARLSPALAGTSAWTVTVTAVGAATMLTGAYLALKQSDMKRILAYSTVSALGTITLLLGLGSVTAVKASVVFLFAHALYKGALFMVAGAVDHETGTRDVDDLGGLRTAMPVTAVAAILAALSLAGLAPVFSFIGKELLFEALIGASIARPLLLGVVVVSLMLLAAVAGIIALGPFTGALKETPKKPHEAPPSMLLGPVVLASGGLLIGVLPSLVEGTLVSPAAEAIVGRPIEVHLVLWHGLNPALLLSVVTLLGGAAIYLEWINIHRTTSFLMPLIRRGPEHWYDLALTGLMRGARGLVGILQTGYLRTYMAVTLLVTVTATGATLLAKGAVPAFPAWTWPAFHEIVLAGVMVAAALVAVTSRSRMGAVAAVGVVGYGIALVFILFSAPDLAKTQFLIETLTVLLFVLVFIHLPGFKDLSTKVERIRDAALSIAVGALMTTLVLAATTTRFNESISGFFAEQSYTGGHGRNVVNVILVDFRGLDTLGEIAVLGIAAIGVYGLVKLRPKRGDDA